MIKVQYLHSIAFTKCSYQLPIQITHIHSYQLILLGIIHYQTLQYWNSLTKNMNMERSKNK